MTQLRPNRYEKSPEARKNIRGNILIVVALLIIVAGPFGILLAAVVGIAYAVLHTANKEKQAHHAAYSEPMDEALDEDEDDDFDFLDTFSDEEDELEDELEDKLESSDSPDLLDTLTDLVNRVKDGRNDDAEPERFHSDEVYEAPVDQSRYAAAPGHSKQERLNQLETLRKAGLFTEEEYRSRKAKISKEP